jgi:hypothetical protein
MTKKKPIVDKGIILYKDYEFLFNFLSDEELGIVVRLLLKDHINPTLNPTDNPKINNVYNYIANRIVDYQKKKGLYVSWGKEGGNPALKPTLNNTLNPTVKLKEEKRKENNIKEEKIIIINNNFQKFFEKYPLRKNKIKTYNIFIELFENEEKPDALFKEIMEGLERYNQEIRTTNKKKEYIMQPNNWLANERWNDEYVEYVDCNNNNVEDF